MHNNYSESTVLFIKYYVVLLKTCISYCMLDFQVFLKGMRGLKYISY